MSFKISLARRVIVLRGCPNQRERENKTKIKCVSFRLADVGFSWPSFQSISYSLSSIGSSRLAL